MRHERELPARVRATDHEIADDGHLAGDPRVAAPLIRNQREMNRFVAGIDDQIVDHDAPRAAFEQRVALHVVGIEIPEQGDLSDVVVNQRTLRVLTAGVRGMAEPLRNQAVAKGDPMRSPGPPLVRGVPGKARPGSGQIFVGRPSAGTMIHNHIMGAARRGDTVHFPAAVLGAIHATGPDAEMLKNDIMRSNKNAAADQSDARRGRGLAGHSDERFVDMQVGSGEINDAGNLKDNNARLLERQRGSQ